jgi:hypothetical protein
VQASDELLSKIKCITKMGISSVQQPSSVEGGGCGGPGGGRGVYASLRCSQPGSG